MKRTTSALALSLACVLALSACGDDDTTAEATASATPSLDRSVCPTEAMEVPAFEGAPPNDDIDVKPTVAAGPEPGPTQLTYTDLIEGDGPTIGVGDRMSLKYVGAVYADGTEFDSSWSRGENVAIDAQACISGTVIPGFAVGPIGMRLGGRRQINIPSELGYGDMPPEDSGIPPGADLIFIVDAVTVEGASILPSPEPDPLLPPEMPDVPGEAPDAPAEVPPPSPAPVEATPVVPAPAGSATP